MNRLVKFAVGVLCLGLLVLAFVIGGARSAVDWGRLRAVAMESDDWGFAGFIPNADAWDGLDRSVLVPGRFPPVYWGTTLEDSADVAALADLLAAARGRDGLPAVLQANYVMASMSWEDGTWREYGLPAFPPHYRRAGLWPAVASARARGVWRAEFHATRHYDPEMRRATALASPVAQEATRRGITLFPRSEAARELGPWRAREDLARELEASLSSFAAVFGRPAVSVIAPDYTWNADVEDLWQEHGLKVIQGKREQRNPNLPRGSAGRVLKHLNRRLEALLHPDRVYLERNCRFEPVQEEDARATVDRCAAEVAAAWQRGEPAIIETHRVNLIHTDPRVEEVGRQALESLLAEIAARGPVFLTDDEIAQIARHGVSRTLRGRTIVLRNATGSRRVVTVAPDMLGGAVGSAVAAPGLIVLPAGGCAVLIPEASGWRLDLMVPRHAR